jgi:uncharacterized integral membrane protein (TIGR00698 family)
MSLRRIAHVWPLIAAGTASVAIVPSTPLRVLGPLTVALLLGMTLRSLRFVRTLPREDVGWLSRDVLRAGVVLVGTRLDWIALAGAGARPLAVAVTAVVVGLAMFALLSKLFDVPHRLGALLAVGSSVCGAAAITAARPVVGANDDEANVGIAIVSILGAIASVALVIAHAIGGISDASYGLVAGGSLHEVAHVMAAGTAAPATLAIATVTKLARVALLPVALIVLPHLMRGERAARVPFRFPPLVVGFLAASALATLLAHVHAPGWPEASQGIALVATLMMASAMVAIGALVDWSKLRRSGAKPLAMATVGGMLLAAVVLAVVGMV